ncbi:MAG: hypothetical protein K0S57_1062, partial [Ramlibacter sp.]|nr:hypothetical protein [Ramlibacter sp.]
PGGHRRRQLLHPQAEPAGPDRVDPHGRTAEGSGSAGRRVQRRAGRQGRGRCAAGAPRREGDLLRRLHHHRAEDLRDRRPPRQARAGAGRRQEPHGRHARCGHGPGGGRADRLGLRLRRRALHGDLAGRAGRRCGGQDHADARQAHAGTEDQERRGARCRDGPDHQQRGAPAHHRLHRPGRDRGPRAATPASGSAARCSTTSRRT